MTSNEDRLLTVLERIERRLAAIEEAQGLPAAPSAPETPPAGEPPKAPELPAHIELTPPAPADPPTQREAFDRLRERKEASKEVPKGGSGADASRAPTSSPVPPSVRDAVEATHSTVRVPGAPRATPPSAPQAPAPPSRPTPPPATPAPPPRFTPPPPPKPKPQTKAKRDPVSIERLIGGKLAMVLGVLIVVTGAAFFLKLAYDQGWHRLMSPMWRCVCAAGFGFLLMGAGEAARAKLGKFAAVGFTAAGLGVLYATAYATYGVFELTTIAQAFWLLVGVCAMGLFTGIRAGSQLLTAMALVGGYVAPIAMASETPPPWALPAYLTALLAIGSSVAVVRTGQRALATLAWWGSGLLGTAWLVINGDSSPLVGIAFVAALWSISHATQTALALLRRHTPLWHAMPLIASTSTTLWAAAGLLYATDNAPGVESWIALGVLAGACLALGLWLGRGVRTLRDRPSDLRARLGIALTAQGAALVPLVTLLAFDTAWMHATAWIAMGVAGLVAAHRARLHALFAYSCAVLAIGTLRTLLMPLVGDPLVDGWVGAMGLVWTPWMALVATAGGAWLLAAYVADRFGARSHRALFAPLRTGAIAAGAAHFGAAILHEHVGAPGLIAGFTVLGAVALVASLWRVTRPEARWVSASYAALAVPCWGVAYSGSAWVPRGSLLVLNEAMLWSAALAGVLIALARLARSGRDDISRATVVAGWSVAGGLLLVSTSVEATRTADALLSVSTVKSGALSLWWALCGVGLIVAGVLRRVPVARYAGLALLLVATAKVVTWDLIGLSPVIRVGSFLVVGLILLAVATGYMRATKREGDAEEQPEDDDADTDFDFADEPGASLGPDAREVDGER